VHADYAGHPLLGDDKYGDHDRNAELKQLGLKRTFLHAQSVAFEWPGSGVPFHVSTPLPPELVAVLDAITPVKGQPARKSGVPRKSSAPRKSAAPRTAGAPRKSAAPRGKAAPQGKR
jgi:hypothetical protein